MINSPLTDADIQKALMALKRLSFENSVLFLNDNPDYADNTTIAKSLVIKKDGSLLGYMSKNIKNNYQVVELALSKSGYNLQYASKELQNDISLIIKALMQNPEVYNKLSEKFKMKKELVIYYLKNRHLTFLQSVKNVPSEFYNDPFNKDVVEMVLAQNGNNLQYFSKKIKNDNHLVSIAVRQNPESLEYASKKIKDNIDIAKMAFKHRESGFAFPFLSPRLQKVRGFAKIILKRNGAFLEYFKKGWMPEWTKDYELVTLAVKSYGKAIKNVDENLRKDIKINQYALESTINCLDDIDEDVSYKPEFLVTLFKVGLLSQFKRHLDKKPLEKELLFRQMIPLLKKEPQSFFMDTFLNIKKDDPFFLVQKMRLNRVYIEVFLDCCEKETLETMKKEIVSTKFSILTKLIDTAILKRNVEQVEYVSKPVKKQRKLGY